MTEHRLVAPERRIYCNRTLNLRSIRAIGYDMDYTLVHYCVEAWERRAYEHLRRRLELRGWPVGDLQFDPSLVERGLVIDKERGNLVKANRFGFVKKAAHGTRMLNWEEQREAYTRTIVDLGEPRWAFLNTLFSLSEACMYAQLVDRIDRQELPEVLGYGELYDLVRETLDETHMEGKLKEEILADPEAFVILDEETALTLLDQKYAGKRLLLITNSEWSYTQRLMSYCFDRFLPEGMGWRDLFEVVIVGARKPHFFTMRNPLFEVATEEGLLRPAIGPMREGVAYLGGSARQVEQHLGLSGDEILYVGDHMFGDVRVTKDVLRWRTALVLRELEEEVQAVEAFRRDEMHLAGMMAEKERLEARIAGLQLEAQRIRAGYGPRLTGVSAEELLAAAEKLREELEALDGQIGPLAQAASELMHGTWGLLMRAGNDKSHLARQVERYADIYMSRVSNLLYATPFLYLRSPRGSLPHDPGGTNVPSPP